MKYVIRAMIVLGIIVYVAGFFYHPGIPYQDPPPELLKKYNASAKIADIIMNTGVVLLVVGVIARIIAVLWGRLNRKQAASQTL